MNEAKLANWDDVAECYRVEGLELARATRLSLTIRHVLNSHVPEKTHRAHSAKEQQGEAVGGSALWDSATARTKRTEQLVGRAKLLAASPTEV